MGTKWFKELVNAYEGRTFVVIGGGPTAAEYVNDIPDDAVIIASNEHGLKLGIDHDFTVAYDQITRDKILKLKGDRQAPAIIGQFGWSDFQLSFFWRCNNSGILAAWCAFMMGARQVIITGMDLYQTGVYFWDKDAESGGVKWELDYQVLAWKEIKQHCKGVNVRVLGSGPLSQVFPLYDPGEEPVISNDYKPPVMMDVRGDLVEFTRNTAVRGVAFEIGEQALLDPADSKMIVQLEKGFIIPGADEFPNVVARAGNGR